MLVGCCTKPEPLAASITDWKDKSTASLAEGKNAPAMAERSDLINSASGDVSADKMELRGGLWHVKGEAKPFTGRVTLWTPGHGNEIARQVVKTYVNGKEQGSKVFPIIGKQAPRPRR